MKAKATIATSPGEIESALQVFKNENFIPTLAIVFLSVKQDMDAVASILHKEGIRVFGTTTSGEFIGSEIKEGSIAIMLLDMNPDYFRLAFYEKGENSTHEIARQLGAEGKNAFSHPAFIIASGWLQTDGEEIIKGIEKGFGNEATIFGGMAGDDLQLREPVVFTQGRKSTIGIVALIIDEEKIHVEGIATCGWKPIGITKTVTKSVGNVVYTIDNQPALDIVIKYLGLTLDEGSTANNMVVNLGAYYPLQLEREDAPPVMRTAMLGNTEDRSLICAGNVPQGAKIRFSLPPDFDAIDTVVNECADLKNEKQSKADAVIMFSCISRYLSFGVMTGEEIERVRQVWNAPFIGFFCYGEFGKSKRGKHEFHNNTCCVVTLKEK
ncbi:MAG: FIST C-terminal domain-containing protein [Bacteroidetes bacterium]|nr:FIST C-terminal domain-containing protein [Bacteroidota bacterium]